MHAPVFRSYDASLQSRYRKGRNDPDYNNDYQQFYQGETPFNFSKHKITPRPDRD